MTLANSRWAQQPHARTRIPRTPQETRLEDEEKATRLLRRLYWKAESLLCSWHRALETLSTPLTSAAYLDPPHPSHSFILGESHTRAAEAGGGRILDGSVRDARKKHAEAMFKVDFFEFYTLLERFVTLCLRILGVTISARARGLEDIGQASRVRIADPPTSVPIVNGRVQVTDVPGSWAAEHRFHANVLDTLSEGDCPLHEALGTQDVWVQLRRAKDYRNWWKDADGDLSSPLEIGTRDGDRRGLTKLDGLELDLMLHTILQGLEKALVVVKGWRMEAANGNALRFAGGHHAHRIYEMDCEADQPFEAGSDEWDEMDWN